MRPLRLLASRMPRGVLRTLLIATTVITLGRGVFLTLTVLYFTLFVGLSAPQIALALTIASAFGVVFSLIAGWLADRLSSRLLFVSAELVAGAALVFYAFAEDVVALTIVASIYSASTATASTVRSTILARAFAGSERVTARAAIRTATNVGIALGGAIAGIVLVSESQLGFRSLMIAAGLVTMASAIPLFRLPATVERITPSDAAAATPGRSPLRDSRYLAFTVLSAVLGLQFGLAEVGVPLWILNETDAPLVMVSVVLIINTVIVIALQIRLSRGTHDLRAAGRVAAASGVLMACACAAYASAAGVSPVFAIALLVIAALAHVCGEILSSASVWGLSFELAEPARAGAYQGVFGMGWSLSGMLAPIVVVAGVSNGVWGWIGLAALFLLSALGLWVIAHRAANAPPPLAPQ